MMSLMHVFVLATFLPLVGAMQNLQPAPNPSATAVHRIDLGIETESIDVYTPCAGNFYGYANGKYIAQVQTPANKSRLTRRDELIEATLINIRTILEEDTGKAGMFYKSFMNEAALSAKGLEPLRRLLEDVNAVQDRVGVSRLAAKSTTSTLASPFGLSVTIDPRDSLTYVVTLSVGGLGLPDREYYLSPSKDVMKTAYKAYVASVLKLVGVKDPEQASAHLLALEEGFASVHLSARDSTDPSNTYNIMTAEMLTKQAPGFDWSTYLSNVGLSNASTKIIVPAPTTVIGMAKLIGEADVSVLQAWFSFHTYNSVAHLLPKVYSGLYFSFYGSTLAGQPVSTPRWIRGVRLLNRYMGDAVGQAFVSKHFPSKAKALAETLVSQLKTTLDSRLKNIDWMTESTKKKALAKLQQLDIQVGYPRTFKTYQSLNISDDDLVGNVDRSISLSWRKDLLRLGQPVDRTEWFVTAQEVNAYSNPQFNQIVFPAALFQPPFFNSDFDMAVNFGAVGALIGHEMVHSFDRIGRHYNSEGRLSDWWTPDDEAAYNQRVELYAHQLKSLDLGANASGMRVNTELTIDEDIADLGGLSLAFETYHAFRNVTALNSTYARQEGDRRVFLAWAHMLRTLVQPQAFQSFLASDNYSPSQARVNAPVKNIQGWYDAFDVSEIVQGYIKPESRVTIW